MGIMNISHRITVFASAIASASECACTSTRTRKCLLRPGSQRASAASRREWLHYGVVCGTTKSTGKLPLSGPWLRHGGQAAPRKTTFNRSLLVLGGEVVV